MQPAEANAETPTEHPTTFEALGLAAPLVEACVALGYKRPTPIQAQAIPYALSGRDIIGLAETGSGKTAAFSLPILHNLLAKPQAFYALVIAPTRELAFQITEQFEALGSVIGVKAVTIVGGIDMMTQAVQLAKRPHCIVGSPGRVVDHLQNTKGFSLRALRCLVLDEADKLLAMDFEKEIDKILHAIPSERSTYLFSATMTSQVAKLQRASLVNPVRVEVSSKYQTVSTLKSSYLFVPAKHKDVYFAYLMNELAGNTAIVFTHTCATTQRLALLLRALGFGAVPLHGQLSQPMRLSALNKFKAGERAILIATDVASRGLDIPSVDAVINYDVPVNSKDYIHRVGRTARAGRSGRAVTIVTQYDVELYQRIEYMLGTKLEQFDAPKDEVMLLAERVSEAQHAAALEMRDREKKRKGGPGGGGSGGYGEDEAGGGDDTGIDPALERLAGKLSGKKGRSGGGGGGGGKGGRGRGGGRGGKFRG